MVLMLQARKRTPRDSDFHAGCQHAGIRSRLDQPQEPSSAVLLGLVERPCEELGLCPWADHLPG